MAAENPIKFIKGAGKSVRAQFQIGNISVPVSAFTKIEKEAEGKTDTALARIFITGLGKKYQNFLEALEEKGISYQEAFQSMKAARPVAVPAGEKARSRTKKEAVAIARALCRKYVEKTPEEMASAFLETVKSEAFKAEIIMHIKALEKDYKRNEQGKIRVRPMRPEMVEQAKRAQAAKKAKAEGKVKTEPKPKVKVEAKVKIGPKVVIAPKRRGRPRKM